MTPRLLSFPKRRRILRRVDFIAVRERGCSVRDGVLRVSCLASGNEEPRLGLAVSRRVGKAVVRNRVKRVIREVVRTSPGILPSGCDVVVTDRIGGSSPAMAHMGFFQDFPKPLCQQG